jgi:cytochrome d ubiquinol oxidase subunit I
MSSLGAGRVFMGDSLGFHILFALFGVGIPLLISLAELIGIVRKDSDYYTMAKRWSFAMGTLFVVGGISGLIISNQMSLLWPTFMTFAGKVIGAPFYMEGFAFFIEAIFLGIYLYSWDKFKNKYTHWLCSIPVVLGSVASAFFITTANAWMNSPAGFTYANGVISNVNPLKAMFNPATYTETSHSIVAYYLTTALVFGSIYAWGMIFHRHRMKKLAEKGITIPTDAEHAKLHAYRKKVLVFVMTIAAVFTVLMMITGDQSARYLAYHEPLKLASAELLLHTESEAPIVIGGIAIPHNDNDNDADDIRYGIKIPELLSILSFGSTDAVVKGLDAFDPNTWPPLWIHSMFDLMVGFGMFIGFTVAVFFITYFWKRRHAFSKLTLFLIALAGPASFLAMEFGWIVTEVGRQPYVIAGIMTASQAFTTSPEVIKFGSIFPSLYTVLLIVTPWVLIHHYKKTPLVLGEDHFAADK